MKNSESRLLNELLHGDAEDAADDGAHAQRRDVESGRHLDADGEDGHDDFEDERQRQQGQRLAHARSGRRALDGAVDVGVVAVVVAVAKATSAQRQWPVVRPRRSFPNYVGSVTKLTTRIAFFFLPRASITFSFRLFVSFSAGQGAYSVKVTNIGTISEATSRADGLLTRTIADTLRSRFQLERNHDRQQ